MEFMRAVSVCHTVIPSTDEKTGSTLPRADAVTGKFGDKRAVNSLVCGTLACPHVAELMYEGDSPDEAALLDGLRSNSVIVKARSPKFLTVDVLGTANAPRLARRLPC